MPVTRRWTVEVYSPTFDCWSPAGVIVARSRWSAYHGARFRHPTQHVRVTP